VALQQMLDSFHLVLDQLTPDEAQLLDPHVLAVKQVLDVGEKPLNWNSLGIPDYIARCNKVGQAPRVGA
jgi:dynein heavy chain